MKKLMLLAGLLAASMSPVVFAEDNNNYEIFSSACGQDSVCAQVAFVNFPDDKLQLSSVDFYQKAVIYDKSTDVTPAWRIDKRAVFFSEEIPSNRISYIYEAQKSYAYVEGVDVKNNVTYDEITKEYVFRINAINDVPVSDCTIQHDSIMDTTGGVKDHMTITRIDDQHYTCSVSQG